MKLGNVWVFSKLQWFRVTYEHFLEVIEGSLDEDSLIVLLQDSSKKFEIPRVTISWMSNYLVQILGLGDLRA